MARTVTLNLLGLNRLSKPLKRAGKDVDALEDQVEDFNAAGKKLTQSFDDATRSTQQLGQAQKTLEKVRAAADKAQQQVTKSSEAVDKARSAEAAAAAKVAQAEAKLQQTRAKSKSTTEQVRAAEVALRATRVKHDQTIKAISARTEELTRAQRRARTATAELGAAQREAAEETRVALRTVDEEAGTSRRGLLRLGGVLGGLPNIGRRAARGLGSALGSVSSNVWVMVGVVAAALAVLPLLGAAAGVALTAAFGAGIAGVGLLAAAQADEVKDAFTDLKDHVVAEMRAIAAPLEGTLVDVAGDLTDLFDSLAPHLEQAFEDMAPALSRFSDDLFGAFQGDGSLIQGATDAFTALLDELGPRLDGVFGRMGDALSDLFATVADNPDVFAGIITGLLETVTGLIRLVDWLSEAYVWIQETVPGGLLTLLSPLTGLSTAFLDTQESSSGFVSALRDMADAVSSAWSDIKAGVDDLTEALGPVVDDISQALASSDVLDTVEEWWGRLAEIVRLAGEGLGGIVSGIASAITFIWQGWGEEILGWFSGLWTAFSGIVSGALQAIEGLLNLLIGVFTGDWQRAWEGIKQIFAGVWTAIVGIFSGAWEQIHALGRGIAEAIVRFFTWLWNKLVGNSIIPDMVDAIVGFFRSLWQRAVAIFNGIKNFLVNLWRLIKHRVLVFVMELRARAIRTWLALRDKARQLWTSLRDAVVDKAEAMRDWVTTRVRTLRDRIVDAFVAVKNRSIDAFERAKDGIARVWGKVRAAAKKPVNFIINTVYMDGIKRFWDAIAGRINMAELPAIRPLATGGVLDGYRPGVDTVPAMLSEGEGVLVPQAVRSLGPDFVHAANALGGRARELLAGGLPGFARGGIVGAVGDFISSARGFFNRGLGTALDAVTDPMVGALAGRYGRSGFTGLPVRGVEHLLAELRGFLMQFKDVLEGGDGRAVVDEARKHVGLSGRPNKFTRPYMPGSWPWCGAFVGSVFERAGAGDALDAVDWKPLVESYRTLPRVPRSGARPGDLALYRGDAGHINIVADSKRSETIGGNESNSVRRQFGYMNSASSIRRPAFATGGVVKSDLLRLMDQDRAVNNRRSTPPSDTLLRQAMGLRHYPTSRLVTDTAPIARALGGRVVPGQTYRVGEDGPEEMTVGTRATVTPIEYGNHYEITVNAPPSSDKAAIGKDIVEHIQEYERRSGARWRK